jgi:hypothetical protein
VLSYRQKKRETKFFGSTTGIDLSPRSSTDRPCRRLPSFPVSTALRQPVKQRTRNGCVQLLDGIGLDSISTNARDSRRRKVPTYLSRLRRVREKNHLHESLTSVPSLVISAGVECREGKLLSGAPTPQENLSMLVQILKCVVLPCSCMPTGSPPQSSAFSTFTLVPRLKACSWETLTR